MITTTCTPTAEEASTTNCVDAPVNGDVLQVMPWADFSSNDRLSAHGHLDLLKRHPCIANTDSQYPN